MVYSVFCFLFSVFCKKIITNKLADESATFATKL